MQNSLFGKNFQIPWPQSRLGDPRGCSAGLCPCWNSLEKCWLKDMEEGCQSWECWALAGTVPKVPKVPEGSKNSKRSSFSAAFPTGPRFGVFWVSIPGQCNVLTVQVQGRLQHCPISAPCAGATLEGFAQMVPLQAATQNPA